MDFLTDVGRETGAVLAYSLVGIALMILGFLLVNLLTPGDLRRLIWNERNRNAALLLSSNLLAVGLVAAAAIWTSDGTRVWNGVAATFIYGVVSLAVMGVAFLLLDALTPGRLGALVTAGESHPAVYVVSSMHLAVALIIVASLS
jgi:uncharacterized membrane protein YjfL (UPF0719 family)